MTEERKRRMEAVADRRQPDLVVVLENVHDPHNISAVMRTADAVGVIDIYLVHPPSGRYRKFGNFGKKSSASASKWLRVHQFEEVSTCMQQLKDQGFTILATHLGAASSSLYSLDLTQRVALVFGNEHAGVSEPCLAYCDGNFVIPQVGFVKSLNISVACAVSLYEAYRQREAAGFYQGASRLEASRRAELLQEWMGSDGRVAKSEDSLSSLSNPE